MRKGLILPLLIPLIAYGAVKGYLWYQVKRFTEQVAVEAADVFTFEYESIETSFDGAAGIRNVRIYPLGSDYPVKVDAIRAVSENWLYFMKLGTPLDKGDLPNELGLQVLGIDVDFNAPYFAQLEAYSAAVNDAYSGCEQSQLSGIELMKKLGYSSLYTDIELAYSFSPESEYITLTMDSSSAGSFQMGLSADVDLGVTKLTRNDTAGIQPKLGGISVHYKDQAFNRKYLQYCAALNNESTDQFVERHIGLLAERYQQLGLVFNKELVEAYRQFISTDGELKLTISTDNPMGMEAMTMGAEEHLNAWDVVLEVNGQLVTPVEVDWKMPDIEMSSVKQEPSSDKAAEANEGQASPPIEVSGEKEEVATALALEAVAESEQVQQPQYTQPKYEQPSRKYVETPINELSKFVGSSIRVATYNGHLIEGSILDVRRNQIKIEQKLDGGVAVLPILFSKIKQAKVLQ